MTAIVNESTSGPEFLRRTAWVALWTGIVAALAVAYRWDWRTGSGFLTALGWALANFAVLAAILTTATRPGGGSKGRLAALMAVKLIGLYGLAAVILWKRWFPILAFVGGFTWPLLVVLLRALGGLGWGRKKTTV